MVGLNIKENQCMAFRKKARLADTNIGTPKGWMLLFIQLKMALCIRTQFAGLMFVRECPIILCATMVSRSEAGLCYHFRSLDLNKSWESLFEGGKPIVADDGGRVCVLAGESRVPHVRLRTPSYFRKFSCLLWLLFFVFDESGYSIFFVVHFLVGGIMR